MLVDETVEAAQEWVAAVDDALQESIARHGLNPEQLLDDRTTEGAAFLALLDPLSDADPDGPTFAQAVEAVAVQYAESLRVTESGHTAEAVETIQGRVLEAKGTAPDGGRIFRVEILRYGDSKNGNRYTESVMRRDAHRYEGAKAYDHHRTAQELQSSTLTGLAGHYRNVEATGTALEGDLCLLPGATHVAEALDATITNQAAGLPALVGISHDVMASFKPATGTGGRRVREAVAIQSVQSADVVADPSAGGQAVRVVQGGIETTPQGAEHTQESEVHASDVLAALSTATPEQLAAVGLSRASESTKYPTERVVEAQRVTEAGQPKGHYLVKLMIREKLSEAGLADSVRESFTVGLPTLVTEADVDAAIATLKSSLAIVERANLTPTAVSQVTRESRDKVVEGLDKFFSGDFSVFRSFKQAHEAFTGRRPRSWDEDTNRQVFRESFDGFDSYSRTTESMDSTTWAQALGDSVTRRMLAVYTMPSLSTWRQLVRTVPVNDFRTQRLVRKGGYGTLPTVNEGQPYQPLTSPGDEEATFAIIKKGGTEDVTLEMVANDDIRALSDIPNKLGRAAARTLYEAVWGILSGNPTCTYDSVALFHATHANTDTSAALSQTTLGVGRQKMRDQAAYGDSTEVLGLQPKYLVVPNELEELAFQLCTGRSAIPATPASASDSPNINQAQGLTPLLVPTLTDANDWFLSCDPLDCGNIEVGFYQGREEPELFTQSDQTVGSSFNSDRVTWKVRHIWKEVVTDHRGLYRGVG